MCVEELPLAFLQTPQEIRDSLLRVAVAILADA